MKHLYKQLTAIASTLIFSIGLMLSCNVFADRPPDLTFATQTELADEADARKAADSTLQGDIDAEVKARTEGDETLQAQITSTTYAVGDTGPGGGIVFHVSLDGKHGLEAAPEELAYKYQWSNSPVTTTNAVISALYGGAFNTQRMIEVRGLYAPAAVASTTGGEGIESGGWFLPSVDTMIKVYATLGPGGTTDIEFPSEMYWTSTEKANYGWAWALNTGLGTRSMTPKLDSCAVLPVRAF